jgi:oligopeptide/dipeptide ABC transporter ATP-binding protein
MSTPLLSIRHLTTEFRLQQTGKREQIARALEDVSFDVMPGQTLGLVGESGCGKTTTLMAAMRLLPSNGRITGGQIRYKGTNLLALSEREMRGYRWKEMAIIFQGAMNALNPVMNVGDQIREAILLHGLLPRDEAEQRVVELLELVGIPKARRSQFPHQYSGGMRQRAMIAMALSCRPPLLFADEPTTALDVMIQAQVLELLRKIQAALGLAIVLVTHDLGVVAEVCDSVVVMYGGKVAEYGSADQIYNHPQHSYTQRLLASFPDINRPSEQLASIPGTPPRLTELPKGCRFGPRCDLKLPRCVVIDPQLTESESGCYVACHLRSGKEAHFA